MVVQLVNDTGVEHICEWAMKPSGPIQQFYVGLMVDIRTAFIHGMTRDKTGRCERLMDWLPGHVLYVSAGVLSRLSGAARIIGRAVSTRGIVPGRIARAAPHRHAGACRRAPITA